MKQTQPDTTPSLEFLRDAFLLRKARNRNYSERAFARDIGISQTHLNLILNGKRSLSLKALTEIGVRLKLDDDRLQSLLLAALKGRRPGAPASGPLAHAIQLDQFRIVSRWYHFAILDLTLTRAFQSDTAWIARTLGISKVEAQDAIDRLVRLGLLSNSGGKLKKAHPRVELQNTRADAAIQSHHLEMIEKAADALKDRSEEGFRRRDMSAVTIAINSGRLDEAKNRINRFLESLTEFLSDGSCDQLYQLNLQLFPLTQEPLSEERPCPAKKR